MRYWFIVVVCAALSACQTKPQPAPGEPNYHLVDLTGVYTRFIDASENLSPDARVAAFKAQVAPSFPGFYDAARFQGQTAADYDARIARSIAAFPALRQKYTAAAASFATALDPAYASFTRAFPDMRPIGDIYLLPASAKWTAARALSAGAPISFSAPMSWRACTPSPISSRSSITSCFTAIMRDSSPIPANKSGANSGRKAWRSTCPQR